MNTLYLIKRIERTDEISRNRQKKNYKPRSDPFSIPDNQFNNKTVLINKRVEVAERTSPELQVLVALRCWGRTEFQDDAGDLHGLSQPSVSLICKKVTRALAKLGKNLIRMPASIEEELKLAKHFREIRNFPGIIGAIDGTHIKIKKTVGDLAQYYINRKGFYSLNVQVVCDAQLEILDLVARWRGSTHDCRIFNESKIKERFENEEFTQISNKTNVDRRKLSSDV